MKQYKALENIQIGGMRRKIKTKNEVKIKEESPSKKVEEPKLSAKEMISIATGQTKTFMSSVEKEDKIKNKVSTKKIEEMIRTMDEGLTLETGFADPRKAHVKRLREARSSKM